MEQPQHLPLPPQSPEPSLPFPVPAFSWTPPVFYPQQMSAYFGPPMAPPPPLACTYYLPQPQWDLPPAVPFLPALPIMPGGQDFQGFLASSPIYLQSGDQEQLHNYPGPPHMVDVPAPSDYWGIQQQQPFPPYGLTYEMGQKTVVGPGEEVALELGQDSLGSTGMSEEVLTKAYHTVGGQGGEEVWCPQLQPCVVEGRGVRREMGN